MANDLFRPAGLKNARVALGIGVFDAVHLGHQKLLARLVDMAHEHDALPVALTFHPHPRAVLCPANPPKLLVPLQERIRLLKSCGAHAVLVIPFSPHFAQLPPELFLKHLLAGSAVVQGICVGSNWRFGANAAGDAHFLTERCATLGLDFAAVPELYLHGEPVSSSSIRRAVAAGKLELATELLGRPYRLFGTVEPGFHVAGSELNRPTANLNIECGVLPPDGVYAMYAYRGGKRYRAAVNIGVSPTFGWGAGRRVEVHLLDFDGNLYGQQLEIEPVAYLRPERTFAGAAELRNQIEIDMQKLQQYLVEDDKKK